MDTKTRSNQAQELLTLSFMRSKAKSTQTPKSPKKNSLLEMTREEFKDRLNQHKQRKGDLVH